MRVTLFYIMVAIGCDLAGWGFWRAIFWPVAVGEIIVATYERHFEAVEGGE